MVMCPRCHVQGPMHHAVHCHSWHCPMRWQHACCLPSWMHPPSLCAAARRGLLLTSGSRLACRSVTEAFLCRWPRPRFCAFCWRAGASSSESSCPSEGKLPLSAALGSCLAACLPLTGLPGTAAARFVLRYMPSGVVSCSLSDPEGDMSPSGLQGRAGLAGVSLLLHQLPLFKLSACKRADVTRITTSPLYCPADCPQLIPAPACQANLMHKRQDRSLTWQIHWWSPHLQLRYCSLEHHCSSQPSCLLFCANLQACHEYRRSQLGALRIKSTPAACYALNSCPKWARELNAVKVCC